MITFAGKGDFSKTFRFLQNVKSAVNQSSIFDKFGRAGVDALRRNTPVDTGNTAESWDYEIVREKDSICIRWFNTNVNDGVNIAILLQYGHGTGTGGFVQGRDYINPAIQPVFDDILEAAWREVTKA